MKVILGRKMDNWNGHPAGSMVGAEEGMRESLARGYIAEGLVEFVEAEKGETPPTKKELAIANRAMRDEDVSVAQPKRREVPRRAVDPAAQREALKQGG